MNDIEKAIEAYRRNALRKVDDHSKSAFSERDNLDINLDIKLTKGSDGRPHSDEGMSEYGYSSGKFHDSATDQKSIDRKMPVLLRNELQLPLKRLRELGYITPDTPKKRLTEDFRSIKRSMLKHISHDENMIQHENVVMVSSATAGEGKTFTAINLAMSLALERERTVLLIDGDVLKGTAGKILGVNKNAPGLIDLLTGSIQKPSDVILNTNVPKLRFMPAGTFTESASELLSSDRMGQYVNEFSHRYRDRIIIIDCSPILMTNEANVLMEHAGQIVFVIAEEEVSQRFVLKAISRIDKNIRVGIVLNKSSSNQSAYGY